MKNAKNTHTHKEKENPHKICESDSSTSENNSSHDNSSVYLIRTQVACNSVFYGDILYFKLKFANKGLDTVNISYIFFYPKRVIQSCIQSFY